MTSDVAAELQSMRSDIDAAADAILAAAEAGLSRVSEARAGAQGAIDELEKVLCAILEACAFQDLAGQRLAKVERLLAGDDAPTAPGQEGLLNGPAVAGGGLDQAAADDLFTAVAALGRAPA